MERNFAMPTAKRSLADTRMTIASMSDMPQRKRGQLLSAMNSFARAVGMPLFAIPESVEAVRDLAVKASPGATGLKTGSWANVKSKAFRCLELAGCPTLSGRCMSPISPAWRALLDRVPVKPHRVRINPLVRALSVMGVEPDEFEQAHITEVWSLIAARHAKKKPHEIARKAVRAWGHCQTSFTFWPQTPIEPISRLDRYSYPPRAFSKAFRDDVESMIAGALRPSLGRRSRQRPIKSSAAARRRYTVYRIASIIARKGGFDPSSFRSVVEIVRPEVVDGMIDWLVERGADEASGDHHCLARTAYLIAKYHVGSSEDDLDELANIRASVAPLQGPSDRNIKLLQSFQNEELRQRFIDGPMQVMKALLRKRRRTRLDAVTSQLAMAWAIMLSAPLRGHNLMMLEDGVNVSDRGRGKLRQVRVSLPADVVKNRIALNFVLGKVAVAVRDLHNGRFRRLLTPEPTTLLFPGRSGSAAKRPANLSLQLAKLTFRTIGVRMTAHQWRHALGYIFLCENPGQYEPVRRFLGHRKLSTTMSYYAFMTIDEAHSRFEDTFESVRQRAFGRRRGRR